MKYLFIISIIMGFFSCNNQPLGADQIISSHNLQEIAKGIYLREYYRSSDTVNCLDDRYDGEHVLATSVKYLIKSDAHDYFHKLKSDEIWYFHYGSPVILTIINTDGALELVQLDYNNPQFTVPSESWYFAKVNIEGFTFLSLTVTPGFESSDVKFGERNDLLQHYPEYSEIIIEHTPQKLIVESDIILRFNSSYYRKNSYNQQLID